MIVGFTPGAHRGVHHVHPAHVAGDWRVVLALSVLLVAVTLLAYIRVFRPPSTRLDLAVVAAAAVVSLLWVTTQVVPEGAILISFSQDHGLTVSDLMVFPLLAAACWLLVRLVLTREDRQSDDVEALR